MRTIAIVGVGLIGASFALAQRRATSGVQILGVDLNAVALTQAIERGAIDRVGTMTDAAACDVVLLAIPVRQMHAALAALAPQLGPSTLVMDVGSTKQDVLLAATTALGAKANQFVACHPIAGREQHGPLAADADLFIGKNVIVCAGDDASLNVPQGFIDRAVSMWQRVGAKVLHMTPAAHDAVFAAVSHLPHLLAFALVDELASRPDAKTLFTHAASGFRDFTRIASSSPEMWRDITLSNRDALLAELDRYQATLGVLREAVASADAVALEALMQRAQNARNQWLRGEFDQFRDESA